MIAAAANLVWQASQAAAATRFRRQLRSPRAAQEAVLHHLLRRNANTVFGRQHGFASLRTAADFSARVPLSTYADMEPWIRRILRGEAAVLTADPVTHLVPTSGSSGARKLIPFTAQLQREFDRAIGPWISDLFLRHPPAMAGPAYWSVSPAMPADPPENSAIPIGFEDDTHYLGGLRRRLVAATLAAPSALRHVTDMESFFLLTLACLLSRRDLSLVSVWHPSFLLLLLEAMPRLWENLLATVHTGRPPAGITVPPAVARVLRPQPARARELGRIGPHQPDRHWPGLAVISCWTDAHAALSARLLGARFPHTTIQSKGLLATEAFVSLPFAGRHPLAVGSHYFEFLDDTGVLHPVDELHTDRIYEVVVTTGGGLWRYRLGDRVRVNDWVLNTPSLEFVGRHGEVSDLRGEKLTGEFVGRVIADLGGPRPARFAMLAPDSDEVRGGYTLFWEGEAPPSPEELDRRLAGNPHYAWCRKLGQLRPARVFAVRSGGETAYFRRLNAAGMKWGDLKPSALSSATGWASCFEGRFLSDIG